MSGRFSPHAHDAINAKPALAIVNMPNWHATAWLDPARADDQSSAACTRVAS
jgi:hypothetical protein